jgi:FkbM family methyltransferase
LRSGIEKSLRPIEQDAAAGLSLWDTPQGEFWFPATTRQQEIAFLLAEQATGVYETGSHSVGKGDIVMDCGANVGVFVRTALRAGAGQVIAAEPAPENIACLKRTFKEEIACGRLVVCAKGVWDQETVLTLRIDPQASGHNTFVLDPSGTVDGPAVPLTTIDHMVSELHLSGVDFIKIDVEGAEVRALGGAIDTIRRFRPRLSVACEHYPLNANEVVDVFRTGPRYQMQCGPCLLADHHIFPEVLYFHPAA